MLLVLGIIAEIGRVSGRTKRRANARDMASIASFCVRPTILSHHDHLIKYLPYTFESKKKTVIHVQVSIIRS